MVNYARSATWERLSKLRRQRRVQNLGTLFLVLAGPVLAITTLLMLGPFDMGATSPYLRLTVLADLVYILVVAALVIYRVGSLVSARRRQSAGSRLHLRLSGVFAAIALIPAVLVAVFAGLTVNTGLEGWFSDRVRQVVGASLAAAEAYENEQRVDLIEDAEALARFLVSARQARGFLDTGDTRQFLAQGQAQIQRGLKEAYIIDGSSEIHVRGNRSYLFDYEPPSADQVSTADNGETLVIEDWENNEFRALVKLDGFANSFLYVAREVDGAILTLLDDTQESARLYQQLESERGRLLFEFSLLYIGFAVILILAAVWSGLWFAERLSQPVGRLAGAAQRVGAGDFDVQVREGGGDDEIAMLGRVFNQMTEQLKLQRDALLDNTRQIENRRRLFDSVLGSVSAGVVGLDKEGRIDFMNRSAMQLLVLDEQDCHGEVLDDVVPEFAPLLKRLPDARRATVQEEVKLARGGNMESLLVRASTRRNPEGEPEGTVVAFDDVTDLVSAQRMAAWGDVARRIAHEIKNPLTPIQLSAERVKRKFRPLVGEESESLDQYTDVIIRQTNDLRRIVDEFSKFARMPDPQMQLIDLGSSLRDAVLLQEAGQPEVSFVTDIPDRQVCSNADSGMMSQAFTNLIKNAGEAIETKKEKDPDVDFAPTIHVTMELDGDDAVIRIADNGIGLPEDRARLFEPYMTTRDKGTGLGLPIVRKIIEEHGGQLILRDAPVFEGSNHFGAMAEIRLPVVRNIAPEPDER